MQTIRRFNDTRPSDVTQPDGTPTMGIAQEIHTISQHGMDFGQDDPSFTIMQARPSVFGLEYSEERDPSPSCIPSAEERDAHHARQTRSLCSPPRNDADVDAWSQTRATPERLPIFACEVVDTVLIDGVPTQVLDGRPLADPTHEQDVYLTWEDMTNMSAA